MRKKLAILFSIALIATGLCGCADTVNKDKIKDTLESVSNNLKVDAKGITDALTNIDTNNLENNEAIQKAQEVLKSVDLEALKQMSNDLKDGVAAVSDKLQDAKANYDQAKNVTFEDTEAYNYIIFEYEPLAWGIDAFNVTKDKAAILTVAGKDYQTYYSTLNTTGTLEKGYTTKEGITVKRDWITKKETQVTCPEEIKVLGYVFNNVRKWEYKPVVYTEFLKNYTDYSVNTFLCDKYIVNLLWDKESELKVILVTDTQEDNMSYTYVVRHLMQVDEVNKFVS